MRKTKSLVKVGRPFNQHENVITRLRSVLVQREAITLTFPRWQCFVIYIFSPFHIKEDTEHGCDGRLQDNSRHLCLHTLTCECVDLMRAQLGEQCVLSASFVCRLFFLLPSTLEETLSDQCCDVLFTPLRGSQRGGDATGPCVSSTPKAPHSIGKLTCWPSDAFAKWVVEASTYYVEL